MIKSTFILLLLSVLILVGCGSSTESVAPVVNNTDATTSTISSKASSDAELIRLNALAYIAGGATTNWWWINDGSELSAKYIDRYETEMKSIDQALEALGSSQNLLARQISSNFRQPFVAIYLGADKVRIKGNNTRSQDAARILFNGKNGPAFSSDLVYHEGLEAVVMSAFDYPAPFLKASLAHELGHRLRHLERQKKSLPTPDEVGRLDEEMEMHELGLAILNEESDGRLFKEIDRINKSHNVTEWRSAVTSIDSEDMEVLEALFSKTPLNKDLRSTKNAGWLIGAALRAAPKASQQTKRDIYHFLHTEVKQ